MPARPKSPAGSRQGHIDPRSSDASGRQADEVKSHAELAKETGPAKPEGKRKDEVAGALKDRTAR